MTDFVQTTLFGPKDSLPSGDPEKIILGADFDVEFANLVTSIASKADDADLTTTDANVAANTLGVASNLASIASTNSVVASLTSNLGSVTDSVTDNTAAIATNAAAIATNTSDIANLVSPVQQVSRNSSLSVGSSAAFVDDPQLSGVLVLEPSSRHSFEAFLILDARFGPTGTQLEIMLTASGAPLNGQALVTVGGLPGSGASGPEATVFADSDLTLPVEVSVFGESDMSAVHIVGSFAAIGGSPAFLDIGYRTVGSTQSTAFQESWLKVTRDTV